MNIRLFSKSITILLMLSLSFNTYAKIIKATNAGAINELSGSVTPGDIIVLQNGTWSNQAINLRFSGTANKPILVKAEIPGKVVLTGSSTLTIAGKFIIVDGLSFSNGIPPDVYVIQFSKKSDHCQLTNCSIDNYNPTDKKKDCKWIVMEGDHQKIDHCFFKNKTGRGAEVVINVTDKPNYNLIDSNYFAGRPKLGFNGGEIIRIGLGETSNFDSKTTVQYNYFENCDGEQEVISSKTGGNVFRFNTFYECQGILSLRHGNHCLVEGNFFLGNNVSKTGGIKIFGEDHIIRQNYFADLEGTNLYAPISFMNGSIKTRNNYDLYSQVKNVLVESNMFVDNNENIVIGINYNSDSVRNLPPDKTTFDGNIFSNSKKPFITVISNPTNFNWNQNIAHEGTVGINTNGFAATNPNIQKDNTGIWRITNLSPQNLRASFHKKNQYSDSVSTMQKNVLVNDEINHLYPLTSKMVGPNWMK